MPRTTSRPGSFGLGILILLLLPAALRPQEAPGQDCATALQEAERAYLDGPVEKVPEILGKPCLRGNAGREELAKAYGLLARAYVILDRRARARAAVEDLLSFDPGFKPDSLSDPVPFVRLVEEVKAAQDAVTTVASVSKTDEPLLEAPATAVVVTAEEIARRGYTDLEQIFHDLPGFDVSRGNGLAYSNLYQRGFRSSATDRTLFLVDGVEQNDLWSNTAYISRQYPVSNVERVEVVYGPTSTMYGANAYAGVVNVITKSPEDFVGEDRRFGGMVELGGGSWDTRFAEFNVAGRNRSGSVSYRISGRTYRSDEPDLSGFGEWRFDPSIFDAIDYEAALTIGGEFEGESIAEKFLYENYLERESDLYQVIVDPETGLSVIVPTAEGIALARQLDKQFYPLDASGNAPGFSDPTDDWMVDAKVRFPNVVVGLQAWSRQESTLPWFTALHRSGSQSDWSPRASSIYLKYSRDLGARTSLELFSRFKHHDLDSRSSAHRYRSYAGRILNLAQLEDGDEPEWDLVFLSQSSTQFRNELIVSYNTAKLDLVAGLEVRNSSIQKDVTQDVDAVSAIQEPARPAEYLNQRDLGLYAQLAYRPRQRLKIVAGGRVDNNDVREADGYGTVFNPRLAVVYSPRDLVFKAVYSEAFKDPSNAEKFNTIPGINEVAGNSDDRVLESERSANIELSAGWQISRESLLDATFYETTYSNVVNLVDVFDFGCYCGFTGQLQNLGKFRVRGAQLTAAYDLGGFDFFGNYTYADPVSAGAGAPRVGDIAPHRLNLGMNAAFLQDRLDLNLRVNYVGARKTGQGTTVSTNPLDEIDPYTVVNAALAWRDPKSGSRFLRGWSAQLAVRNLLDADYEHPGVSQAGVIFAPRLPQPGRSVFLRLSYSY